MRTLDPRTAVLAVDVRPDRARASTHSEASGVQAKRDPLVDEDLLDGGRDLRVFPLDETRSVFDDRDLRSEPPEHLPEFQADITPAHDEKMRRHAVEVHHRTVGQKGGFIQSRHRRYGCPSANIDEDAIAGQD